MPRTGQTLILNPWTRKSDLYLIHEKREREKQGETERKYWISIKILDDLYVCFFSFYFSRAVPSKKE